MKHISYCLTQDDNNWELNSHRQVAEQSAT